MEENTPNQSQAQSIPILEKHKGYLLFFVTGTIGAAFWGLFARITFLPGKLAAFFVASAMTYFLLEILVRVIKHTESELMQLAKNAFWFSCVITAVGFINILVDSFCGMSLHKLYAAYQDVGWYGALYYDNLPVALTFEACFLAVFASLLWMAKAPKEHKTLARTLGTTIIILSVMGMFVVKHQHLFVSLTSWSNTVAEKPANAIDVNVIAERATATNIMVAKKGFIAFTKTTENPDVLVRSTVPIRKNDRMAVVSSEMIRFAMEDCFPVILEDKESGLFIGYKVYVPVKLVEAEKPAPTPEPKPKLVPAVSPAVTQATPIYQPTGEGITDNGVDKYDGYIETIFVGRRTFTIPPHSTLWKKASAGERWDILPVFPKPADYSLRPYGKKHLGLNEIDGGFVDLTAQSLIYGIMNLEKDKSITVEVIVSKRA
jgi:hypothetical protein